MSNTKSDRWFSGWCWGMEGHTPEGLFLIKDDPVMAEGCEAFWEHRPDRQPYWSVTNTMTLNPYRTPYQNQED